MGIPQFSERLTGSRRSVNWACARPCPIDSAALAPAAVECPRGASGAVRGRAAIREPLRIGARGSRLSRAQAESVAAELRAAHSSLAIELVWLTTTGDRDTQTALSAMGAQGVFAKEIEAALLEGRIDVAVHSLKDLPTAATPGLAVVAVPKRADPRDALVTRDGSVLRALPPFARVGTGSTRRAAQLRHLRPDVEVVPIRGNVDTRLGKLEAHGLNAVLLAMAGLERTGLRDGRVSPLEAEWFPHAPGQGALGLQCREDDSVTQSLLEPIDDPVSRRTAEAERAALAYLGGGCQAPFGVCSRCGAGTIDLLGCVTSSEGRLQVRRWAGGHMDDPDGLGRELAEALLAAGAGELLSRERSTG